MSALDFFDRSVREFVKTEPRSSSSTPRIQKQRQPSNRAPPMCLPWQPNASATEISMVKQSTNNRMQPRDDATWAKDRLDWRQERAKRDRQEWEALRELIRFLEYTGPSCTLSGIQKIAASCSDSQAHKKAVRFSQHPSGQENSAGFSKASKRRNTASPRYLTGKREVILKAVQAPTSTSSTPILRHPRFSFERRLRTLQRSGSALSLFTWSKDTSLHEPYKHRKEDHLRDEQALESEPPKTYQDDTKGTRKSSTRKDENRNRPPSSTKTRKRTQLAVKRKDSGIGTPENEKSWISVERKTSEMNSSRNERKSGYHNTAGVVWNCESHVVVPAPAFDQLTKSDAATPPSKPPPQAKLAVRIQKQASEAEHRQTSTSSTRQLPRGSSLLENLRYNAQKVGTRTEAILSEKSRPSMSNSSNDISNIRYDESMTNESTTPSSRKETTRARKLRDRHTQQPSIDHIIREPLLDGDGLYAHSNESMIPSSDIAASSDSSTIAVTPSARNETGLTVAQRRTPKETIQRQSSGGPPSSAPQPPPNARIPSSSETTLNSNTTQPITRPKKGSPILLLPFTTPVSNTKKKGIAASSDLPIVTWPDPYSVESNMQARLNHLERQNRLLEAALKTAITTAGHLNKCSCSVNDRNGPRHARMCNAESFNSVEENLQRHVRNGSGWSAASSEQREESVLTVYMATRQTATAAQGKVVIV